jgi:hypothetical protein
MEFKNGDRVRCALGAISVGGEEMKSHLVYTCVGAWANGEYIDVSSTLHDGGSLFMVRAVDLYLVRGGSVRLPEAPRAVHEEDAFQLPKADPSGKPDGFTVTASGMLRENKANKPQYLDYLDHRVLARYGRHMKKHALGDNWKKGGYGEKNYLQSLVRHAMTLWAELEGHETPTDEDHAAAIFFNIQGLMAEQESAR